MIGSSMSLRTPLAVLAATACVTGVALAVSDQARSVVDMAPVGVWFANDDADSISHIGPAGTDATVQIKRPDGLLRITELDGIAYVTDDSGRLSRIDPAQLVVSQEVTLPATNSQLIGGGGRLYVVDRATGNVRELDPEGLTTIGETGSLGKQLGQAVVDADGVLWVVDRATGEVIAVEGRAVKSSQQVAEPGEEVRLSVVSGVVVAINPATSTVTEISGGSRSGQTHTVEVDGTATAPTLVSAGTVLPVVSGSNLVTLDLRNGRTLRIELATPDHQLGTPAISGNRVYVPDFTAGTLIVVDLATQRVVDTLRVTGRAGEFELVVDNGRIFVNDPSSERAWALDSSGALVPVAKYDPSRPGDGRGTGVVPPPPPPDQPDKPEDEPDKPDQEPNDQDRPKPTTPSTNQNPQSPPKPPPATTQPPVVLVPPPTTKPPRANPPVTVPGSGGNGQGEGDGNGTGTTPRGPTTTTTTSVPPDPGTATGEVRNVTAVAGDEQATVTWQAPTGWREVTGYRIVSEPGGKQADAGPNDTQAVVGDLDNGTSYVFVVTALSDRGDGLPVRTRTAVTPTAPKPLDPTNPTATPGDGQATISWRAPARGQVSTYTVDAIPTGGGQTVSTQVDGSQTQAPVTGLINGKSYYATVRANAKGQTSNAVPTAQFTPVGRPGRPSVGASVSGAGTGDVTVTWTAPADDGGSPIEWYTITTNGVPSQREVGTLRQTVFKGLTIGNTYTFEVVATNAQGDGPKASSAAIVVQSQVPGSPGGVTVSPGDRSATITWTAAPGNGVAIDSYRVRNVTKGTPATTVKALQHTFDTLDNGTAYEFEVQAFGANGAAGPPVLTPAVTPAGALPAPSGVTATALTPVSAAVTFNAASMSNGNPIDHWEVTTSPATATLMPRVGDLTLPGLTPGTSYTIQVVAVTAGGAKSPAANATVTTPQGIPSPVTNLRVTSQTINTVSLVWDAMPYAEWYIVNPGDGVTPEFRADTNAASWNPPDYWDSGFSATVVAWSSYGAAALAAITYWLPPDPYDDPCYTPNKPYQICP